MRLRRSVLDKPGITRRRRGAAFIYRSPDGKRLKDPPTLTRIRELVIPPAWKNVWVCPHANGHIQVVGTDAAGRRQYLYHQEWQDERAEEKFDRVVTLSRQLPQWRIRIAEDLTGRGLSRDRVLALALHLVDIGYFRAGGEQYADENESYGLATLLCEHVTVRQGSVSFDYPAKSGVQRALEIDDAETVRAARALVRRGRNGHRFLVCRTDSGWVDVHACDLNARFKEMVGPEYTVKDLRTWHATVLAARAFAGAAPPVSRRAARTASTTVMREVAEALGNTPAVARSAYVDPRVVTAYEDGHTIAAAVRRTQRLRRAQTAQEILEKATRCLILRTARGHGGTPNVLRKSA